MKNLATCTPSEFVSQTAKIREAIAGWLEVTEFQRIRNKKPTYEMLPAGATAEDKAAVLKRNAERLQQQTVANLNEILDNMLAKHPQETLRVLALCCFVDPSEVDSHPMDEYFNCVMDMMENKAVMRFFSLLVRLERTPTSTASKT